MKRRDSLKSLLVGGVAGGLLVTGCAPEAKEETPVDASPGELPGYGRTEAEKEHDREVLAEVFLNEHELETLAVLCDLILPANAEFGSATDAGVVDFIDFIVKDMPSHQLPIRGGVMWLDSHSNKLHNLEFKKLTEEQQKAIVQAGQIGNAGDESPAGFQDARHLGENPEHFLGVLQQLIGHHQVIETVRRRVMGTLNIDAVNMNAFFATLNDVVLEILDAVQFHVGMQIQKARMALRRITYIQEIRSMAATQIQDSEDPGRIFIG